MTEPADAESPPILVCYDGSNDAARAVDTVATHSSPGRRSVVLTVAPAMTFAEGRRRRHRWYPEPCSKN